MITLDLAKTGLDVNQFPSIRPWAVDRIFDVANGAYFSFTLPSEGPTVPAKTINAYELRVLNVRGRWKRCFVICQELNPDMKPVLVVGLPSTPMSANADGARELLVNTAGVPIIEFRWVAQVVRDQNVFAVVIDRAHGAKDPSLEYGLTEPYTVVDSFGHPYPNNPYDPLIDDVACIEAARDFINEMPMLRLNGACKGLRMPLIEQMIIGGLSWGSISASWLLAACPDFIAGYLAGMYLNGNWYNGNPAYQPGFNPTEWQTAGFNYSDALKNSKAREIVLSWGSATDDAYVGPPASRKTEVDNLVAALQSAQPGKFVKNVSTSVTHHAVDLANMRAKMGDWMNRLTSTSWSII